jgi:hypothetical protein
MSHTSSCGAAQHHPASIDMLHLPAEALSCVFGNLCIVSLRALSQACQWACEQVEVQLTLPTAAVLKRSMTAALQPPAGPSAALVQLRGRAAGQVSDTAAVGAPG